MEVIEDEVNSPKIVILHNFRMKFGRNVPEGRESAKIIDSLTNFFDIFGSEDSSIEQEVRGKHNLKTHRNGAKNSETMNNEHRHKLNNDELIAKSEDQNTENIRENVEQFPQLQQKVRRKRHNVSQNTRSRTKPQQVNLRVAKKNTKPRGNRLYKNRHILKKNSKKSKSQWGTSTRTIPRGLLNRYSHSKSKRIFGRNYKAEKAIYHEKTPNFGLKNRTMEESGWLQGRNGKTQLQGEFLFIPRLNNCEKLRDIGHTGRRVYKTSAVRNRIDDFLFPENRPTVSSKVSRSISADNTKIPNSFQTSKKMFEKQPLNLETNDEDPGTTQLTKTLHSSCPLPEENMRPNLPSALKTNDSIYGTHFDKEFSKVPDSFAAFIAKKSNEAVEARPEAKLQLASIDRFNSQPKKHFQTSRPTQNFKVRKAEQLNENPSDFAYNPTYLTKGFFSHHQNNLIEKLIDKLNFAEENFPNWRCNNSSKFETVDLNSATGRYIATRGTEKINGHIGNPPSSKMRFHITDRPPERQNSSRYEVPFEGIKNDRVQRIFKNGKKIDQVWTNEHVLVGNVNHADLPERNYSRHFRPNFERNYPTEQSLSTIHKENLSLKKIGQDNYQNKEQIQGENSFNLNNYQFKAVSEFLDSPKQRFTKVIRYGDNHTLFPQEKAWGQSIPKFSALPSINCGEEKELLAKVTVKPVTAYSSAQGFRPNQFEIGRDNSNFETDINGISAYLITKTKDQIHDERLAEEQKQRGTSDPVSVNAVFLDLADFYTTQTSPHDSDSTLSTQSSTKSDFPSQSRTGQQTGMAQDHQIRIRGLKVESGEPKTLNTRSLLSVDTDKLEDDLRRISYILEPREDISMVYSKNHKKSFSKANSGGKRSEQSFYKSCKSVSDIQDNSKDLEMEDQCKFLLNDNLKCQFLRGNLPPATLQDIDEQVRRDNEYSYIKRMDMVKGNKKSIIYKIVLINSTQPKGRRKNQNTSQNLKLAQDKPDKTTKLPDQMNESHNYANDMERNFIKQSELEKSKMLGVSVNVTLQKKLDGICNYITPPETGKISTSYYSPQPNSQGPKQTSNVDTFETMHGWTSLKSQKQTTPLDITLPLTSKSQKPLREQIKDSIKAIYPGKQKCVCDCQEKEQTTIDRQGPIANYRLTAPGNIEPKKPTTKEISPFEVKPQLSAYVPRSTVVNEMTTFHQQPPKFTERPPEITSSRSSFPIASPSPVSTVIPGNGPVYSSFVNPTRGILQIQTLNGKNENIANFGQIETKVADHKSHLGNKNIPENSFSANYKNNNCKSKLSTTNHPRSNTIIETPHSYLRLDANEEIIRDQDSYSDQTFDKIDNFYETQLLARQKKSKDAWTGNRSHKTEPIRKNFGVFESHSNDLEYELQPGSFGMGSFLTSTLMNEAESVSNLNNRDAQSFSNYFVSNSDIHANIGGSNVKKGYLKDQRERYWGKDDQKSKYRDERNFNEESAEIPPDEIYSTTNLKILDDYVYRENEETSTLLPESSSFQDTRSPLLDTSNGLSHRENGFLSTIDPLTPTTCEVTFAPPMTQESTLSDCAAHFESSSILKVPNGNMEDLSENVSTQFGDLRQKSIVKEQETNEVLRADQTTESEFIAANIKGESAESIPESHDETISELGYQDISRNTAEAAEVVSSPITTVSEKTAKLNNSGTASCGKNFENTQPAAENTAVLSTEHPTQQAKNRIKTLTSSSSLTQSFSEKRYLKQNLAATTMVYDVAQSLQPRARGNMSANTFEEKQCTALNKNETERIVPQPVSYKFERQINKVIGVLDQLLSNLSLYNSHLTKSSSQIDLISEKNTEGNARSDTKLSVSPEEGRQSKNQIDTHIIPENSFRQANNHENNARATDSSIQTEKSNTLNPNRLGFVNIRPNQATLSPIPRNGAFEHFINQTMTRSVVRDVGENNVGVQVPKSKSYFLSPAGGFLLSNVYIPAINRSIKTITFPRGQQNEESALKKGFVNDFCPSGTTSINLLQDIDFTTPNSEQATNYEMQKSSREDLKAKHKRLKGTEAAQNQVLLEVLKNSASTLKEFQDKIQRLNYDVQHQRQLLLNLETSQEKGLQKKYPKLSSDQLTKLLDTILEKSQTDNTEDLTPAELDTFSGSNLENTWHSPVANAASLTRGHTLRQKANFAKWAVNSKLREPNWRRRMAQSKIPKIYMNPNGMVLKSNRTKFVHRENPLNVIRCSDNFKIGYGDHDLDRLSKKTYNNNEILGDQRRNFQLSSTIVSVTESTDQRTSINDYLNKKKRRIVKISEDVRTDTRTAVTKCNESAFQSLNIAAKNGMKSSIDSNQYYLVSNSMNMKRVSDNLDAPSNLSFLRMKTGKFSFDPDERINAETEEINLPPLENSSFYHLPSKTNQTKEQHVKENRVAGNHNVMLRPSLIFNGRNISQTDHGTELKLGLIRVNASVPASIYIPALLMDNHPSKVSSANQVNKQNDKGYAQEQGDFKYEISTYASTASLSDEGTKWNTSPNEKTARTAENVISQNYANLSTAKYDSLAFFERRWGTTVSAQERGTNISINLSMVLSQKDDSTIPKNPSDKMRTDTSTMPTGNVIAPSGNATQYSKNHSDLIRTDTLTMPPGNVKAPSVNSAQYSKNPSDLIRTDTKLPGSEKVLSGNATQYSKNPFDLMRTDTPTKLPRNEKVPSGNATQYSKTPSDQIRTDSSTKLPGNEIVQSGNALQYSKNPSDQMRTDSSTKLPGNEKVQSGNTIQYSKNPSDQLRIDTLTKPPENGNISSGNVTKNTLPYVYPSVMPNVLKFTENTQNGVTQPRTSYAPVLGQSPQDFNSLRPHQFSDVRMGCTIMESTNPEKPSPSSSGPYVMQTRNILSDLPSSRSAAQFMNTFQTPQVTKINDQSPTVLSVLSSEFESKSTSIPTVLDQSVTNEKTFVQSGQDHEKPSESSAHNISPMPVFLKCFTIPPQTQIVLPTTRSSDTFSSVPSDLTQNLSRIQLPQSPSPLNYNEVPNPLKNEEKTTQRQIYYTATSADRASVDMPFKNLLPENGMKLPNRLLSKLQPRVLNYRVYSTESTQTSKISLLTDTYQLFNLSNHPQSSMTRTSHQLRLAHAEKNQPLTKETKQSNPSSIEMRSHFSRFQPVLKPLPLLPTPTTSSVQSGTWARQPLKLLTTEVDTGLESQKSLLGGTSQLQTHSRLQSGSTLSGVKYPQVKSPTVAPMPIERFYAASPDFHHPLVSLQPYALITNQQPQRLNQLIYESPAHQPTYSFPKYQSADPSVERKLRVQVLPKQLCANQCQPNQPNLNYWQVAQPSANSRSQDEAIGELPSENLLNNDPNLSNQPLHLYTIQPSAPLAFVQSHPLVNQGKSMHLLSIQKNPEYCIQQTKPLSQPFINQGKSMHLLSIQKNPEYCIQQTKPLSQPFINQGKSVQTLSIQKNPEHSNQQTNSWSQPLINQRKSVHKLPILKNPDEHTQLTNPLSQNNYGQVNYQPHGNLQLYQAQTYKNQPNKVPNNLDREKYISPQTDLTGRFAKIYPEGATNEFSGFYEDQQSGNIPEGIGTLNENGKTEKAGNEQVAAEMPEQPERKPFSTKMNAWAAQRDRYNTDTTTSNPLFLLKSQKIFSSQTSNLDEDNFLKFFRMMQKIKEDALSNHKNSSSSCEKRYEQKTTNVSRHKSDANTQSRESNIMTIKVKMKGTQ